jgi:glycosyltransferase involved in cell wall biosynthesis
MKIIQVIARFHLGGSEQVAVNLAHGLARRGHECWVVAITKAKEEDAVGEGLKRRLASADVRVVEFAGTNYRLAGFSGAVRLTGLCCSIRPDIVHSHTDRPDFAVSLAGRLTRMNLARTIHNTVLWESHWLPGRIAEAGFRDDLVVLISEGSRRAYGDLRQRYGLPESRNQTLIPNGILFDDADRLDRTDLVRDFGADPSRMQLCFAGRFTHQKGFDVLLDAVERLSPTVRNRIEIHAFGKGEEGDNYMNRARHHDLPIRFHQPIFGISRLLPAFDAVIMPSRYEGLPLVALESLVAGVPVIATAAPGLNEVLPVDWPLTVPSENPAALAGRLAESAREEFDMSDLGSRASLWARQKYALEPMVDAYETAYRKFLEREPAPAVRKNELLATNPPA